VGAAVSVATFLAGLAAGLAGLTAGLGAVGLGLSDLKSGLGFGLADLNSTGGGKAVAGSGKGALRTTNRQAAIAHSTRVKGARVKGARIKRFASKNRCMIAINPVTTKSELKMMN
jgi:hypothetical protein